EEHQVELLGLYGAMVGHLLCRKQADSALQEKETKFSTLFQTTPDAISLSRFADGTFLEVNQSFTAHSGYLPDEAVGKTSFDLKVWKTPEDRLRLTAQLLESGRVNDMEVEFRRKDGSSYTGLLSATVVDIAGERCILAINRDISERQRLEE